jgi:hypothetical protein
MKSGIHQRFALLAFCVAIVWIPIPGRTAESYVPFEGEKSAWHDGFERYDYLMDEESLAVEPFKAPAGEKFGIGDPPQGKRRCVVIVPKAAAAGNPWSWQACYLGSPAAGGN